MANHGQEIELLKAQIVDLLNVNIALLEGQIGILNLTVSTMYGDKIDVKTVFDEIQQAHTAALKILKGMTNG